MSKRILYLEIFFTEPGSRPMKIVAVVDKAQLYSLENGFIHPLNYRNKNINKDDITDIIPLQRGERIKLSDIRTDIYSRLKAEV